MYFNGYAPKFAHVIAYYRVLYQGLEELQKKKKKRKSSQVMMQQAKLSPQNPSNNSTHPHHNGVADKYTSSKGTILNISGTNSREEEIYAGHQQARVWILQTVVFNPQCLN